MSDSKEYITLINKRDKLRLGFKKNTLNLAGAFQLVGLIDGNCYETATSTTSSLTTTEKAEVIVKQVIDSVQLSGKNYHEMLKILANNLTFYGTLVEILDEEYASQGGTKRYSKVSVIQGTTPKTNFSLWDASITIKCLTLMKYVHPRTGEKTELRILDYIALSWKEIGAILNFSPEEMSNIQCIKDVVIQWIKNAPNRPQNDRYPATWRGMYNLLKDMLYYTPACRLEYVVEAAYSDLHMNFDSASSVLEVPDDLPDDFSEDFSPMMFAQWMRVRKSLPIKDCKLIIDSDISGLVFSVLDEDGLKEYGFDKAGFFILKSILKEVAAKKTIVEKLHH